MKSIHDRPYYKKVYKRDSKNLKILIGHGSKQPKHAKKGAPYTKNPQKRRPVNKLSAPIIALDEAISEDFKTRFNEIKQATFVVKMKKEVNPYYVTILDKEKTYNGIIKDNNITITNTEKGSITKTKKDFLDKLAEYGELCNVVYCDDSTITIGTKTLTFSEMLKPVEKKPEQPKKEGPIAKRNKEQGAIVGSIADDVAKGKSIEKSVLDQYGHTAMGRRFAKGFADAAGKALKESGLEGDTLKAAALTSVMMGMVARVPFDVIGTFTGQIPDGTIKELVKTLGPYLSTIAPVLEDLQKKLDAAEKMAKGVAAKGKKELEKGIKILKSIGGGIVGLPDGEGKKTIYLGNSQTSRTRLVMSKVLKAKNYESTKLYSSGKFDLVHTGDTDAAHPSYYHKGNTGYETLEKLVKSLGGPDKVGLISVNMGDAQDVGTWEGATDKMIKDLRELIPNVAILWIGAPPIQKPVPKTNAKRKQNTLDAKKAVIKNGGVFINPFDYFDVNDDTFKEFYIDDKVKVHLNIKGIGKMLLGDAAKKQKPEIEIKADSVAALAKNLTDEQRRNAAIIEKEFIAAGYSKNVVAAAIANSSWESGLGRTPIGDGGASVGLFQINRPAHKRRIKPANDERGAETKGGKGIKPDPKDVRFDPTWNTKYIIKYFRLKRIKEADKAGASIEELTKMFGKMLGPGIPHFNKRAARARRLFSGATRIK